MLRILLTLLAANLLVFLWLRGSFDSYLPGGRDPDRLNQQVDAERLRVAPAGRVPGAAAAGSVTTSSSATASASTTTGTSSTTGTSTTASTSTNDVAANPVKPVDSAAGNPSRPIDTPNTTAAAAAITGPGTPGNGAQPIISNLLACSEFAPLDAAMLARARKFFADHAAYFVSETEPVPESASFLVYSTPVENLAAAQRKFLDFKRQGFEGISIITEGPLQFGMSFGSVRTEALAKSMVERLTTRGVRSLRISSGGPDALKSLVRFRYQAGEQGLPADVGKDLATLSTELGLKPATCSAKSVPAPTGSPAGRPSAKL